MIGNFDKAFALVIGEEGHLSNDPWGGFTVWGLASRYYPQVTKDWTIDQAKAVYFQIWTAASCNELSYPMDIAAFDAAVNPGPGEEQILIKENPDLSHFMRGRMRYYCKKVIENPAKQKELAGWIIRVLNLWITLEKPL